MKSARVRLHYKIVIPFALVALVASASTAYVSLRVTENALQSRVDAQILSAASLITQGEFALNPAILNSVKAIAGADVVTFTTAGTVVTSTLGRAESEAIVAGIRAVEPLDAATYQRGLAAPALLRRIECGGRCDVAYRRLPSRPDTVVAVVTRATALAEATRAVTSTILVAALLSVAVMVLVSQLVARRVTAPLDALVRFTLDVAEGDSRQRAATGGDEVGRLGRAFNVMLDRLERSQDALVRSEKLALAGLFAARVAHDIRNPLSAIKMQTQLLRDRLRPSGDAQSLASLEAVRRDIGQVESVVRDLLELARPGELRRERTQVNDMIRDVLQQMAPQLSYRRIHIDQRLDNGLPEVSVDADRMKQALVNIINNAADAMPTGGTLSVTTSNSGSGSTLRMDICDDGTGVDPAIRDRVFDPFVSTKRDGVGLGLVNAKAVIDMHGGLIELAPREPKGTRVTITLPLHHG
jgi:signal transduction histidine kinase